MGQCVSFSNGDDHGLFKAIRYGDVKHVKNVIETNPSVINNARKVRILTPLHLVASTGQIEILTLLLEHGAEVNPLDRYGKTPLMLACKKKKWACVEKLLDHGANVLVFGSSRGRTCLHYAAKGGNIPCVQRILAAATSGTVANSWGVSRFVNVHDRNGITALHLASLGCHITVVKSLLSSGALVSALTLPSSHINGLGGGRTPLHAAARGGSVECVRELLAWGADRSHADDDGYTAYGIANAYHNFACAALLNPNTAEPLVWPSPLKFMDELEPEARILLEAALIRANNERQQHRKQQQPQHQYDSEDLSQEIGSVCPICFEQSCTIQVQDCGHQMCATCVLRLCCHTKPDPLLPQSSLLRAPACPFCRQCIAHLVVVRATMKDQQESSPSTTKSMSKSRMKWRAKPSSSGRIVDLSAIDDNDVSIQ